MIIGGEDGAIKALIVFAGGIAVGERFMKHVIEHRNTDRNASGSKTLQKLL
jgi:hypothetical protein